MIGKDTSGSELENLKQELMATKVRASLAEQTVALLLKSIFENSTKSSFKEITEPAHHNLHDFYVHMIMDGAKLERNVSEKFKKWFKENCERVSDSRQ